MTKGDLNPLIPLADLKNVVKGLVAVQKPKKRKKKRAPEKGRAKK